MIRKLGQQLRINRSKIKETSDTNTDFDDLDSAIRSGYFLKDGLSNHEDFYYLNLLITVTADNPDDLDWKCAEMKKLLISQDMNVQNCNFCQEQALRSSFPLVKLDKSLFERSKRNVLTLGAASCYPFTAYELCDDNGILLGVNKSITILSSSWTSLIRVSTKTPTLPFSARAAAARPLPCNSWRCGCGVPDLRRQRPRHHDHCAAGAGGDHTAGVIAQEKSSAAPNI